MMPRAESPISKALAALGDRDWEDLRTASRRNRKWQAEEWLHSKCYRANPPNLGNTIQSPVKGASEAPYERRLLYPSADSRFSLGEKDPVAYFSSPGLWLGLLVAAGFVWGAIEIRRRHTEV